jgi:hypothetical protein
MINLTLIGKVAEAIKCSDKTHLQIGREMGVPTEFVYKLMLMYYGVGDNSLKSLKSELMGEDIDIGQYLNNNLSLIETEAGTIVL